MLLGRVGATYLVLFLSVIDLGVVQNPVFGTGRPPASAVALPGYPGMRAVIAAAFVPHDAIPAVELIDDGASADAIIDYRIHHAGARGPRSPKVFKLTRRFLTRREPVTIEWRHRFENVSVRRIHAGPHTLDVQVNGRVLGSTVIEVDEPPPGFRAATPGLAASPA